MISYQQALRKTLDHIAPLNSEIIPIKKGAGRVTAEDLHALVHSPSWDVSLKDGYAIRSKDIHKASSHNPIHLKLLGLTGAGDQNDFTVMPGTAVRVLTGARVPSGADAVVSEEYARLDGPYVGIFRNTERGRNVLLRGSDVALGDCIVQSGELLSPAKVGALTAAGRSQISVVRQPHVSIISTGDEVVEPGQPLLEGKLYASNLYTLYAWCSRYGMPVDAHIVPDNPDLIAERIQTDVITHDAILTSGGAWKGDRDFLSGVLERLAWEKIYHRTRMGPGKAAGFGLLRGKPVFVLPGGPPSNLMAFLQLSLPGLLKLNGRRDPWLPVISARLAEPVRGRSDWTQFIFGNLQLMGGSTYFHPLMKRSRLQSMAEAEGVIDIPEGLEHRDAESPVLVQLLF